MIRIKLRITVHADEYHLIWATWYLMQHSDRKLTKKSVSDFLKNQIGAYGTDYDTLIGGDNANIDWANSPDEAITRARDWVSKKFKEHL